MVSTIRAISWSLFSEEVTEASSQNTFKTITNLWKLET